MEHATEPHSGKCPAQEIGFPLTFLEYQSEEQVLNVNRARTTLSRFEACRKYYLPGADGESV